LLGEREDRGGFAGSWRAVEEHVRQVGGLQGAGENLDGVILGGDFGEGFGATTEQILANAAYNEVGEELLLFLDPWLQAVRFFFAGWCFGRTGLCSGLLPSFEVEEVCHGWVLSWLGICLRG
jgi:hypothetical protein